ncbi:hypothetical protein BD626DRAFT_563572 [Schizophyllum amplum]|uniref:Uncharacterized protein n=1 Tax=Schizophyllum amplum TaxID=97359 RepID=A0A550CYJ7_9AGAR|nr:hypothetical protein BD626DRAFT_563572 [Auriculariopsis ampla]
MAYWMAQVGVKLEPRMMGIFLKYQFYKHWDNFPDQQEVILEQSYAIQKMLDNALAGEYLHNGSAMIIDRQLRIAEKREEPLKGECLPGRMMQHFYHDQLLNLHSQRGARSDRQQSVFNNPPDKVRRSWFITFFGAALFWAPSHHLAGLNNMWVDKLLAKQPWNLLVSTLLREWDGHRLVATILITANVSFLGVNDLPSDGIVKIACFLSTISSSTSFVLITALEGRIRNMESLHNIVKAQAWLNLLNNENIGLEILAVLLGLPYGLTIMVFFTIAFMSYCMHDVKSITAIIVGTVLLWHLVILIWSL